MIYSENRVVNRHVGDFVFETMNALPVQERFGFKQNANKVLGPKGDTKAQASVVNYLYRSIMKTTNAGFSLGSLYSYAAKSKGDITKMEDWSITTKCKSELDNLYKPDQLRYQAPMKAADELLVMLIAEKKNFEYGFKYNIEIIQVIYCYLAEAYYELLDIMAMYTAGLYETSSPRPYRGKPFSAQKDMIVITNVNMILDMYKSGEWAKFMKEVQNSKVAATESFIFDGSDGKFSVATVEDDPFAVLEGNTIVNKVLTTAGVAFAGIGAIITIFYAIRGLIAYFFRKANSYKNHLETQARLLDVIASSDTTMTPEQKDKILKKKANMEALSANISRKIFKADKEAKEDMREESAAIAKAMAGSDIGVGTASAATPAPNTSDDGLVIL